ncbi:MAG: hypothetical protein ACI8S6_002734 [Myxococcota bacterium]|jgi:hypothetical protein
MNARGPLAVPPPERASPLPRTVERLAPEPESFLNSMPSVRASSKMLSMESSTVLMKQAEH